MRRSHRAKIIATLGPASDNRAMIARLFEAGADVFRLNMSHLPREKIQEKIDIIRSVEAEYGRPIAVLADLQGPKLRLGEFAGDHAVIEAGKPFILDSDPAPGDATRVYLPHPEILSSVEPGHTLLIDDGKLRLVVEKMTRGSLTTRVVVGGTISSRKGVSVPDTTLPLKALTDKDAADLRAAVAAGVDWVALSFVQRPQDLEEVRRISRGKVWVLAKIEKPQAVSALDDIIRASDALMVARGDLGVEMPPESVPGIQKRIVRAARNLGKPVVIATQMLESMITAPIPTRAEVSDVATAVYDGADAIMLSAESAAGQYPAEAVATMSRIAAEVERDELYWTMVGLVENRPEHTPADAIAVGVHRMCDALKVKTIVAWSDSGQTVLRVARERSNANILAMTPHIETARRLALIWGVHALQTKDAGGVDDMVCRACRTALEENFAGLNDTIAIVAGIPFGKSGSTNMVRLARVCDEQGAAAC
ncbi:MAG: pyruvate kinase [Methylobacteriaceae bacterium]|jgi:pyruvate kinase|nr:pyruvate kinase [Methylobacteriaceae bacterium]